MGWAGEHLSHEQRREIAKGLFQVTEESGNWLNGKCPLHDDSNPSFGYNFVDDYFKCLAECTDSGDLIKLWSLIHGYGDADGFRAFKEKYAPDAEDSRPRDRKPKKQDPKKDKVKADPASVIPEETWSRMGQLPKHWKDKLKELRGWSPEVIERMDLRMQTVFRTKQGEVKQVGGDPDRIALPVRDDQGQLRNVRLYKPGAKQRKIISWGKAFGSARLYPARPDPQGTILLCEGEPDTLCAMSFGFNAITQTSKVRSWSKEHLEPFRGRDVVIAYDADQAGQRYAVTAGDNLAEVAGSVRILEWPDYMGRQADGSWPDDHGQDLTDFFVKHGKGAGDLQELILQAKTHEPTKQADVSGALRFFARGASGRFSFKPRLLANAILQDVPLLSDPATGQLYRWNSSYWEEYHLDHVKRLCLDALGDEAKASDVNDSANMARILSTIPSERELNDCPEWIPLQNGMLNIDTLELKPHAKDYYATHLLNVNFDPESTRSCDRWLQFLEETVQTPEVIAQVQEFFGYCLTRWTNFEKALFLLGPGADGKSTMLSVLREMVGPINTSAVSFADLEDQFHRGSLFNKLLNISTEVGAKALESPYFKAIVSGDNINAAFKHNNPFEFRPYCKLAFASNKMPKVLDNTDGLFRKLLIIRFKRQFLQGGDKHLLGKLLDELSEIFGWALAGLHRLRSQGEFTDSEETRRNILDYRRLNNPVLCFVEDRCTLDEGMTTGKDTLYSGYRSYCARSGYGPLNKENFFRELYAALTNLKQTRARVNGKREQAVKGIHLELDE